MKNLNNQLRIIYEEFIEEISGKFKEHELDNLSLPILIRVFDNYYEAKKKILFVGRETYSWYGKMNEPEKLSVD